MKTILSQIEAAELAGDTAALAAIARALAGSSFKPVKAKSAATDAGQQYLTPTERLALGLPALKDGKIGGAPYRWVLVTFANGYRSLVGYYPRVKNPDDLTPAVISARARYLLILSGQFLDASKADQVPAIASTRVLTDPAEIDRERIECMHLRLAFEKQEQSNRRLQALRDRAERRQMKRAA